MKVLVIGAGLGGLALANHLRREGIEVAVRERDPGLVARFQGYRIGLAEVALAALEAGLPPRLRPLLEAVGGELTGGSRLVDPQLRVIGDGGALPEGTLFDRAVLRALLAAGVEGQVGFGKAFRAYAERPDGSVEVTYADGTTETADVVVGADGQGSAVRRQLLPAVRLHDRPEVGAIGRTMLTERFAGLVPGWSTMVTAPDRQLVLGTMRFREPPPRAAARLAPEVVLPDTPSYIRWVMLLPEAEAGRLLGDLGTLVVNPHAALAALHALVEDWHPDLRALIAEADHANSGIGPLRDADPLGEWPTGPVTLLGDAGHPAPPGGLGGSLAMVDAADLAAALGRTARGEQELHAALAGYEHRMRTDAVEGREAADRTFARFAAMRAASG